MAGLSEAELIDLEHSLEVLGIPISDANQPLPSLQQIKEALSERLANLPKHASSGLAVVKDAAYKAIDYTKKMNEVEPIVGKRSTTPDALEQEIQRNTQKSRGTDAVFATASQKSGLSQATISINKPDNEEIPEDFTDQYEDNLRVLGTRWNQRTAIVGPVTGFVAGLNIARIMSIPGNTLIRMGGSSELTHQVEASEDTSKVLAATIYASTNKPGKTILNFENIPPQLAEDIQKDLKTIARKRNQPAFKEINLNNPEAEVEENQQAAVDGPTEGTEETTIFSPKPRYIPRGLFSTKT